MRCLLTPRIARMRVISSKALLNTAVYRLQPTYWKTRSDSRKRAITQPNRLLGTAYYWQSEVDGCQHSSMAAENFLPRAVVCVKQLSSACCCHSAHVILL